jgi:hypothetical protein
MLPHHGAAANFDEKLIRFAPDSGYFATADAIRRKQKEKIRPPLMVRELLGKRLKVITQKRSTTLVECSGPPSLLDNYLPRISKW